MEPSLRIDAEWIATHSRIEDDSGGADDSSTAGDCGSRIEYCSPMMLDDGVPVYLLSSRRESVGNIVPYIIETRSRNQGARYTPQLPASSRGSEIRAYWDTSDDDADTEDCEVWSSSGSDLLSDLGDLDVHLGHYSIEEEVTLHDHHQNSQKRKRDDTHLDESSRRLLKKRQKQPSWELGKKCSKTSAFDIFSQAARMSFEKRTPSWQFQQNGRLSGNPHQYMDIADGIGSDDLTLPKRGQCSEQANKGYEPCFYSPRLRGGAPPSRGRVSSTVITDIFRYLRMCYFLVTVYLRPTMSGIPWTVIRNINARKRRKAILKGGRSCSAPPAPGSRRKRRAT